MLHTFDLIKAEFSLIWIWIINLIFAVSYIILDSFTVIICYLLILYSLHKFPVINMNESQYYANRSVNSIPANVFCEMLSTIM